VLMSHVKSGERVLEITTTSESYDGDEEELDDSLGGID